MAAQTTIQQLGPGFNVQMQQTCDVCGGKGTVPKAQCPVCSGTKLQREEKELEAVIERGMPDGHELVFQRASEQSPGTVAVLAASVFLVAVWLRDEIAELIIDRRFLHADTTPGDVIIALKTQPHHRFRRAGNDLHMDHTIT